MVLLANYNSIEIQIFKYRTCELGGISQNIDCSPRFHISAKNIAIMKFLEVYVTLFFIVAAISPGICAQPAHENSSSIASASAAPAGTPHADLIAYVNNAVAYAKANGKDKAIKEFNNNKSVEFIKDDLYVFAYDFDGNALAMPFQPELVGKNRIDVQDPNGVKYKRGMVNLAKRKGGFLYYIYPDPARNMTQRLKLSYISKVDDTWWLGAGIYLSNISANFSQESRNNLTNFVESALKYAKDNGKDKALQAFNDKNGGFFKGSLYVFADDFAGNTLALPVQPELIGKNRIDIVDPNGIELVRDMVDLAKNGGGFIYYIYPDPERNMTQRFKLSYVSKVDDAWWLAAGVYAQ